jgi:hypothetical protein
MGSSAAMVSEKALAAFPPPHDRVLFLVVDSTLKGKRARKNLLVKKGRFNEYAPFTCGLHVMLLIAQWDNYRVPLAFRLVQPKKSQGYRSENALFREMLKELVLPAWCQMVTVVAVPPTPRAKTSRPFKHRNGFLSSPSPVPGSWPMASTG